MATATHHIGWEWIERNRPATRKLFLFLVVPLALIPPLMIVYAGTGYAGRSLGVEAPGLWIATAAIFYVAELLTVFLMAWAIKSIAETRGMKPHSYETFAVAAIAPVPMWLSALGLFVPAAWFIFGIAVLGLLVALVLVYRGVAALLHMHEPVEVMNVAYTAMALGVCAWAFLGVLVFLPLLV